MFCVRGGAFQASRALRANHENPPLRGFCSAAFSCSARSADRGIPFESKRELPIFYKGRKIEKTYIPDVICYGQIILELKAVSELTNEHRAQLLNYLRMTKSKLGLLINFAAYPKVRIERYAN